MADWLTSTINGAGSLATSVINNVLENKRAKEQREWNEQMQDKQNAWNVDMWNMQNAYNSPSAQKERMLAAGLNPLNYGMDSSNATELTSAQVNPYERASVQPIENPIAAGLNASLAQAQKENLQADTAKKGQETITEVQRRENMKVQLDKDMQEIENMKKQGNLTDKQAEQIEQIMSWYDRIQTANVAKVESETNLNNSQRKRIEELLEGEKIIQAKSIEEFQERWESWRAAAARDRSLANLNAEDLENYALNHMQSGIFGTGWSLPNNARNRMYNSDGTKKKDRRMPRQKLSDALKGFANNVKGKATISPTTPPTDNVGR